MEPSRKQRLLQFLGDDTEVAVRGNEWAGFPRRTLALAYGVGRVGCFMAGDDYGLPTDLPWGVAFPRGLPPSTAYNLRAQFGVAVDPSGPWGVDTLDVTEATTGASYPWHATRRGSGSSTARPTKLNG